MTKLEAFWVWKWIEFVGLHVQVFLLKSTNGIVNFWKYSTKKCVLLNCTRSFSSQHLFGFRVFRAQSNLKETLQTSLRFLRSYPKEAGRQKWRILQAHIFKTLFLQLFCFSCSGTWLTMNIKKTFCKKKSESVLNAQMPALLSWTTKVSVHSVLHRVFGTLLYKVTELDCAKTNKKSAERLKCAGPVQSLCILLSDGT